MIVWTVVRRVLAAIPVLVGVSLIVFGLVHLAPGSAIDMLVPPEAPPAAAESMKAAYGLDRPLPVQYLLWLRHLAEGDLGLSIATGDSVRERIEDGLAWTLLIAVPAWLIAVVAGVLVGVVAAFSRGRLIDDLLTVASISSVSLPHYWVGLLTVAVFAVVFQFLPAQGAPPDIIPQTWADVRFLILPILALTLGPFGVIARFARTIALDVLSQDFVAALRARGVSRGRIIRHVIRNIASPLSSVLGLQLGYLLAGSILIETVFNWPGIGTLLGVAIFNRDIPVVQGAILVLASLFVVINLLADLLQSAFDPRLRK